MRSSPLLCAVTQLPELRTRSTVELLTALLDDADGKCTTLNLLATSIDGAALASVAGVGDELRRASGLSARDAVRLATALELGRRAAAPAAPLAIGGPIDVARIAERELRGLPRETVLAIACDAANRPLRMAIVSQGTVNSAPMPVREILHFALRWDASAFAVAHNHPAGVCEPSDGDVAATNRLVSAARTVGLRFLGHIIVGDGGWADVPMLPGRTRG